MKKLILCFMLFLWFLQPINVVRAEVTGENSYNICLDECVEKYINQSMLEFENSDWMQQHCRITQIIGGRKPTSFRSDTESFEVIQCPVCGGVHLQSDWVNTKEDILNDMKTNGAYKSFGYYCKNNLECSECLDECWNELKENNPEIVEKLKEIEVLKNTPSNCFINLLY